MNSFYHAAEQVFDWIISNSLYASVLILVILIFRLLLHQKIPANILYVTGIVIILKLLIPYTPEVSWGLLHFPPATPSGKITQADIPELSVFTHQEPTASNLQQSTPAISKTGKIPEFDLKILLVWVWLTTAIGTFSLPVVQSVRFSGRLRNAPLLQSSLHLKIFEECKETLNVKQDVQLVELEDWKTPAIYGIWRPHLLLPAGLKETVSEDEFRMILLHELIHLKKHDIIWNWVVILLNSIYWFNPLVWISMNQFNSDREVLCDLLVLEKLGSSQKLSYGNLLIKLSEKTSTMNLFPNLVPRFFSKKQITRRITVITNTVRPKKPVIILTVVTLMGIIAACFTKAEQAYAKNSSVTTENSESKVNTLGFTPTTSIQVEQREKRKEDLLRYINELKDEISRHDMAISGLEMSMEGHEADHLHDLGIYNAKDLQDPALTQFIRELQQQIAQAKLEVDQIESQVTMLTVILESGQKSSLLTVLKDDVITSLIKEHSAVEQALAIARTSFSSNHPEIIKLNKRLEIIDSQIERHMQGTVLGVNIRQQAKQNEIKQMHERMEVERLRLKEIAKRSKKYLGYLDKIDEHKTMKKALTLKLVESQTTLMEL
ncbi:MAG: M56 family metallopeptidase [Verrucomicrobiota bacterium]